MANHRWLFLLVSTMGESSGGRGKAFILTSHLPEVTFKLSTGTKGVSVALDEPDVTGGEKG